ncbi:MAG: N-acetylneuraminate synthase family protein [Candidatus Thorarchaeota archaeon]
MSQKEVEFDEKTRVMAVIPARSGSKGVKNKNLKMLAGLPLICWTIKAALASQLVDRVFLSTDSTEIAKVAGECGAEVPFLRPENLAQDDTPTAPVIRHAIEWFEKESGYTPEIIVTLQPTSPLRTSSDIDDAIRLLVSDESADSVVGLCETKSHPYWTRKIDDNYVVPFIETDRDYNLRQDLPPAYQLNGAIYVTRSELLLMENRLLGQQVIPYIMPSERSVDIDTELDFRIAESLIRRTSLSRIMEFVENKDPIYIIAEAGVNHNGEIAIAKKIVDAAKNAGADAVKFQTYKSEKLVIPDAGKTEYQLRTGDETQQEMLKKYELSSDDFRELKKYCDNVGIEFLSTPYDPESLVFLTELGVSRIKIASADIVDKQLLAAAASSGKQVILSTGMATMEEVARAVNLIKDSGNDDVLVLHCTTSYPTSFPDVKMGNMLALMEAFDVPVGFSDHTSDLTASLMAASLGARCIERHLTLDRNMVGPDHFASLEPDELKTLVTEIRKIEQAKSSGYIARTPEEERNVWFMRKSIHAARDLTSDTVLSSKDLIVCRPQNGASSWLVDDMIGKKLIASKESGDPILMEDIE